MKKDNKKKENKTKIVLKRILNIFCYIATAWAVLLSILMIISSCNSKENINDSVKPSKLQRVTNQLVDNTPYYFDDCPVSPIEFKCPTFTYTNTSAPYLTSLNRIRPSGSVDLYLIDYSKVTQLNFSKIGSNGSMGMFLQSYSSSAVNPPNQDYYATGIDNILFYRSGISCYVSIYYSSDPLTPTIFTTNNGYGILGVRNYQTSLTGQFNPTNFYDNATYVGTINSGLVPSYLADDYLDWMDSVYSYFKVHRYDNYLNLKDKKFVINPIYDFSQFTLRSRFYVTMTDFYDMSSMPEDFYDCRFLTLGLTGNEYGLLTDICFTSTTHNNSTIYVPEDNFYLNWFVTVGSVSRILPALTSDLAVQPITSTDPWRYTVSNYVFTFPELIPIQDSFEFNQFGNAFLLIDEVGNIKSSMDFRISMKDIRNRYEKIFYDDSSNLHSIRNWFYTGSNLYIDDVSWKSFVQWYELWTQNWYFSNLSYYPERENFNNNPIHTYVSTLNFTDPNFSERVMVRATQINYQDFMFFVVSNMSDLRIYEPVTPAPVQPILPTGDSSLMDGITGVIGLIKKGVDGIVPFFDIRLGTGLTLGMLFFAPFVAGLLIYVIKLFKR